MCRYRLVPSPGQEAILRDALRARPVRVEPGRRAGGALAPGPRRCARLPGAVPAAHRGAARQPVAARRVADGAAAGTARLRPGDGELRRRHAPQARLAPGRTGRGIPRRRGEARPCPAAEPEDRPGLGAEGRLGPVPLVPRRPGGEVLPGQPGSGRPLARRLRRHPGPGPGARHRRSRGRGPGGGRRRGLAHRGTAAHSPAEPGPAAPAPSPSAQPGPRPPRARTAARGRSGPSPGGRPATGTPAGTGPRRPARTWPAGST